MTTGGATRDREVEAGVQVGSWMIESLLGEGGMALVFAAQHVATGERGALKVLRAELSDDAEIVARFARESRVLRGLDHPSVVPVLDTGRLERGRPWLVLAELEGCTLRARLDAQTTLPPREAWRIARSILDALAAAHAAGVVHRDVKPGNIFLEGVGALALDGALPRLLDFGLAKADERIDPEAVRRVTRTGVPVGTPAYMAPEQWWGKPVDGRTDLYALGATLFELLAGTPPYEGATYAELVEHVLHAPTPSLAARVATLPPAVDAFVAKLLARDPMDRYANAWMARAAGDDAFAASVPEASPAAPPHLGAMRSPEAPPAAAQAPSTAPSPAAVVPPPAPRAPAAAAFALPPPARAAVDVVDAAAELPFSIPIELADAPAYPPIPRPSPLPVDASEILAGPAPVEPALAAPPARPVDHRPRLTPISADDYTPRYLRTHVVVAVVGVLAIVALGYAGAAPRDVLGWMRDGGWGMAPIVLGFFAVAGLLPRYGVRRAMQGAPAHAAFALAALPVVLASIGTWLSWSAVRENIGAMEPAHAFVVLHVGVVEAHVPRFVGFALGAVSFLLLAALPTRRFREQRMGAWRAADAAALALALLALVAAVIGARSGAFVAAVAAAATFLGRGLSLVPTRIRFNEAIDHAVASLVATLLAIAAAFARLDALVAAPFGDVGITRAARVDQILEAAEERSFSRAVAAIAVAAVLGIAAFRLIRLRPAEGKLRVPRSGMAVLLAMPAFFALDAAASAVFHTKRAELDLLLAPQFSLQTELVPPEAKGGWLTTPVDAPTLQITRSTVAVEGRPVARVAALSADATRDGVVQEIARAVAADPPTQDHPDLALLADRGVAWETVELVLRLARQAGARKVDVLLTRGEPIAVPKGAPPEAGAVTPGDFAALRIEIGVTGQRMEGATFDAVAATWLAQRRSAAPLPLGVGW